MGGAGFDLHTRDHVKPLSLLISFHFKLAAFEDSLLDLIEDHVKHVFEHVKFWVELPCSRAIASNFV